MRKLKHYQPFLSLVLRMIVKETRFRCRPGLGEILTENPRLVVALSHGAPLSWLPAIALLTSQVATRGGGDRLPMGVLDHFFFQVPIMRELARYLSQSERSLSYAELADRFETREDIDLVLFPEGSNCFFGPSDQIQELRSVKFIELSVRTGAPILLGVHSGSERWAKSISVSPASLAHLDKLPKFVSEFLERRIRQSGIFTVPLLPLPIEKFEMLCELYLPELTLDQLSENLQEKKEQLRLEGERMRNQMIKMLEELKGANVAKVAAQTEPSSPSVKKKSQHKISSQRDSGEIV